MNELKGMPIRIDRLRPTQAAQAGELLAASHADYPSFRHLFPAAACCGCL